MSWKLVGHQWAEAVLQQHIASDSVRHAYLITGPAAAGKRTLALRFAQALNCSRASQPGRICWEDECRSCQLIPDQRYPDLHVVAEALRIDEVRKLQSRLSLAPYEGQWRVAVLPDFQLATLSAANAMLKLLEEPPSKVVLILTAPTAELLLPTVVSRCETLLLRPVSRAEIASALEQRGASLEHAEFLAILSGGRPGLAIGLWEDPDKLETRAAILQELAELMRMTMPSRFDEVTRLIGKGDLPTQRKRLKQMLDLWASIWRDLVHDGYRADTIRQNPDRLEDMLRATAEVPPDQRLSALRAIAEAQAAVDTNANLRLTLETLLMDLPVL